MRNSGLTLIPHMSEKSYEQAQKHRVYAFKVIGSSNKETIKKNVEEQYKVSVVKVAISKSAPKKKRTISVTGKRMSNKPGMRSGFQKAYVTLKVGDTLPIFAAIEQAEAKEQETQAKVDKAVAKQSEKESKTGKKTLRRSKQEKDS